MPRGFLVKRNKKTCPVSYRKRGEDSLEQVSLLLASADMSYCMEKIKKPIPTQPLLCNRQFENVQSAMQEISEDFHTSSLSPASAVNPEDSQRFLVKNCFAQTLKYSSPFQAEPFQNPYDGNFNTSKSPTMFPKSSAEMTIKLESQNSGPSSTAVKRPTSSNAVAKQTSQKRQRLSSALPSEKLLNFQNKVTSVSILGLHIKEQDLLEDAKQWPNNSMLGEFICQLCKERYSDPLTLAQHQCSRIARVEYRCAQCDKVFNCPANLASHRRWHKPMDTLADTAPLRGTKTELSILPVKIHNGTTSHSRVLVPPSKEEVIFSCRWCGKKFQQQSYLQKHLVLHNRKAGASQQNKPSAAENEAIPNYHIPKPGTAISPGPFGLGRELSQISQADNSEMCLKCRFCGDSFFSSPGLNRHINRCHPEERSKVVFLPQRV